MYRRLFWNAKRNVADSIRTVKKKLTGSFPHCRLKFHYACAKIGLVWRSRVVQNDYVLRRIFLLHNNGVVIHCTRVIRHEFWLRIRLGLGLRSVFIVGKQLLSPSRSVEVLTPEICRRDQSMFWLPENVKVFHSQLLLDNCKFHIIEDERLVSKNGR